ncbi:MAG: hypothetical protein HYX41_07710 [Bdellovibrio sp.]|nr:hypothetical protein [Bdellovibrio sp.]
MKKYTLMVGAVSIAVLSGCGQVNPGHGSNPANPPATGEFILKARTTFQVAAETADSPDSVSGKVFSSSSTSVDPSFVSLQSSSVNGSIPITIGNGASTTLKLDSSEFVIPVVCNSMVDFGFLGLSALADNNLNLCGPKGNEHCGTAILRMYTTGTAGPGLWNEVDQFGAPLFVGNSTRPVGLGAANAVVVQTLSIPKNKHTVKLSDFTPAPRFGVKSDFSDAGAGSYTTTLVLEYGLAE